MREWGSPLEWSSRSPYMASGLGFPFEVGGPSSGSITSKEGLLPWLQRGSRDPRTYWWCCYRYLGERLVLQARQVFWSLDKVIQGLPRSPGLWIRSLGPLVGRRGFWQVGSTWQGPLGPWSVGTHGYPCLSMLFPLPFDMLRGLAMPAHGSLDLRVMFVPPIDMLGGLAFPLMGH
jgi:hypothetical protein